MNWDLIAFMRKLLLIFFAAIGSLSGMLFFFLDSTSSTWSLSAVLSIIANVALGASGVCLNSFVSLDWLERGKKLGWCSSSDKPTSPLIF
jgi:MFS-type transporter involved in bile tolerance (Atg22 family)